MTLQFSFCEGVSASGSSPWHIRPLEKSQELRLSGGIDTDSLCTVVRAPSGWDCGRFSAEAVRQDRRGFRICHRCKDLYEDYLRVGDLYYEHEGKKYVRMRDIDGLEKQVLEGLAKLEWYVLHNPGPEKPFFLMEFSMRRRLHKSSRHWFKPEEFRIRVPENKVSQAFLTTIRSQRSAASSSIGTSSARRGRRPAKRTTSASRR